MLSYDRMLEIQKLSRDFTSDLVNIGLIPSNRDHSNNANSGRPRVVSAAVCAGLYPQVARILRPPKRFEDVMGSALEKETDGKEVRMCIVIRISRAVALYHEY